MASLGLKIDWDSGQSHLLINPRLPPSAAVALPLDGLFAAHFWLMSSSGEKWVALSKKACLSSAAAVNAHLESGSHDVWLNPLPDFHVGGLGIWARCHLSQAKLIDFKAYALKWDPILFHQLLEGVTLTALVPAQLYDLVQLSLKPSPSLRAVIIGGGALHFELQKQAMVLGWPLLPSYGLTECASQVATAKKDVQGLIPLNHLSIKIVKGLIWLKSPALLTAYFKEGCIFDPKEDGWFRTEDRGEVNDGILHLHGRDADFIKVGGESVDLAYLESRLQSCLLKLKLDGEATLIPISDLRLGSVIHLAVAGLAEIEINKLMDCFHAAVLPYEKVRKVHKLPVLPRSPIGKILRKEVQSGLGESIEV